jgi:hypothetical protein
MIAPIIKTAAKIPRHIPSLPLCVLAQYFALVVIAQQGPSPRAVITSYHRIGSRIWHSSAFAGRASLFCADIFVAHAVDACRAPSGPATECPLHDSRKPTGGGFRLRAPGKCRSITATAWPPDAELCGTLSVEAIHRGRTANPGI